MRRMIVVTCLVLAGCASDPHKGEILDICLTNLPGVWTPLQSAPPDSAQLKSLAKSSFAYPPANPQELWYTSSDQVLLCKRQDWCIAENWIFVRKDGDWTLASQNGWGCFT